MRLWGSLMLRRSVWPSHAVHTRARASSTTRGGREMSATTMVEAAEMTETMKAWGAEGKGSADVLQLRDVAKPEITDGRVLVKVRTSSVNAADYHGLHGGWLVTFIGELV